MGSVKTSKLTGPALDWAVAKCEGYTNLRWHTYPALFPAPPSLVMDPPRIEYDAIEFSDLNYSTDWAQGGPIIDRMSREGTFLLASSPGADQATFIQGAKAVSNYGSTPLVAVMRCYVASKLGDTVDIPEDLTWVP